MPFFTKKTKSYVVMFSFVLLPTFSFFNFDFPSLFNLGERVEQESAANSNNSQNSGDSSTVKVENTSELIQEEDVLGIYDRNIVISARPRAWNGHALITFSPQEDKVVDISTQNFSDQVNIKLYRTNIDTFLNALVRDENNLLLNKVDTSQMSLEAELTFTPEKRDELTPHDVQLPLANKTGIWYLEASNGNDSDWSFINISKTGIILEEGNNEFLYWGYDYNSQRAVTEGKVINYNLSGGVRVLDDDKFDVQGVATTRYDPNTDIAVVNIDDEYTIVRVNLLQVNTSYWRKQFADTYNNTRTFLFTDRPLYKPGDIVYYKAVLRLDNDAIYTLPRGSVIVRAFSGWNPDNSFYTQNVNVSSDGTISGSIDLPDNIKTGDYTIEIEYPRDSVSQSDWLFSKDYDYKASVYFAVEHYRKPEYTVDVSTKNLDFQ